MLPLQTSAVRAAPTPPLSISLHGIGGTHPPTSSVRYNAPLITAFLPQLFEPPLQPSYVNTPPLNHLLALYLQQDVPPLKTSAMRDAPLTPLSVLLQW